MAPVSKGGERHTCWLNCFCWLYSFILQGRLRSCIVIQHSFRNYHFHPCPFVKFSCKVLWSCCRVLVVFLSCLFFWYSWCNINFCGCSALDQTFNQRPLSSTWEEWNSSLSQNVQDVLRSLNQKFGTRSRKHAKITNKTLGLPFLELPVVDRGLIKGTWSVLIYCSLALHFGNRNSHDHVDMLTRVLRRFLKLFIQQVHWRLSQWSSYLFACYLSA